MVVPIPVLTPPNTDTLQPPQDTLPPSTDTVAAINCTPFLQRTIVQRDAHHADSAFLQLPCAYYEENNKERYPLLIFLNGMYEGSNYGKLNKLLKLGPPKYMADSLRFKFNAGGKKHHMIVVCPQSEVGFRKPWSTNQVIDYMISKYRVDTTRIYLTGLSAGANSVFTYLTDKREYAARIAAVVPMSTTFLDSTHKSQFRFINEANVHTLIYCGIRDTKYFKSNQRYAEWINAVTPGLAEFVPYEGAHKGWNPMYNPTHRYYNPNMYEWLLQFSN
jgi:predicted peptidase